jgi:hypothetical protein
MGVYEQLVSPQFRLSEAVPAVMHLPPYFRSAWVGRQGFAASISTRHDPFRRRTFD